MRRNAIEGVNGSVESVGCPGYIAGIKQAQLVIITPILLHLLLRKSVRSLLRMLLLGEGTVHSGDFSQLTGLYVNNTIGPLLIIAPLSLVPRPTWPGDEATLVSKNVRSESQRMSS